MPHLHLPEDHTDADLILAGQIAASVGSGELYIAWTHAGGSGAQPSIGAQLREPLSGGAELVGVILDCVAELWRAIIRPAPRPAGPSVAG